MPPKIKKNKENQLVVNWHITEPCNFGCRYCYAHWPHSKFRSVTALTNRILGALSSIMSGKRASVAQLNITEGEVWKDPASASRILGELSKMASIVPGEWVGVPRLNIAGGEPMLLWKKGALQMILDEAERLGFALSIITNASLLTDGIVRELAPRLQIIGVSMDSADPDTNRKIGRCGKSDDSKQVAPERVADIFRLAREVNPGIECKLNTVVCAHNWREDMRPVIEQVAPDRWKVFQMLPIGDTAAIREKQRPLIVTNGQFEAFRARHSGLSVMRPENNDDMTESYVMVDPLGRFYQNEPGASECHHRHIVSKPIHKVGAEKAWREMRKRFDTQKFRGRYIPLAIVSDSPSAAL